MIKENKQPMKPCDIKGSIKKHPALAFIIALQVLFIIILLIRAFGTPIRVIPVDTGLFRVDGECSNIVDGKLKLYNEGVIAEDTSRTVSTTALRIPFGAYKVDIKYNSHIDDSRSEEYAATVSMSSRWHIEFDETRLKAQNTAVSGRLYIPVFSDLDDLKIKINYNGSGTLNISSIVLTEAAAYRFMSVLGFALLFLIADLGIAAFFTDIEFSVKREYVVLLLITAAASLPLFAGTLFNGHDLSCHILRLASVAEELGNGQLPVRMYTRINNGYGYPWSVYYCDLFLYPFALLYILFVPLRVCYQLYVVAVNAFTAAFTYKALGKVTRDTKLRLLGTGLYVLCVYRLVNVNVRVAVGEYTAMAFLPLIIAGLYLIYTKEKTEAKDGLYLALGMSGVVLSHVLTVEMIAINLVILCIILIKRTLKKEALLSLIKAALLSIGITAWFVIPFLDYYVHQTTRVQKGDLYLLEDSATELIFLLQSFTPGKNVGHYAAIGLPYVFGIGLILYCLVKYKKKEASKIGTLRVLGGLAVMNFLFVCKGFPWGRLQRYLGIEGLGYKIGTIQFIWRFLSMTSVLLAFAIIIALDMMGKERKESVRLITLSLIGCLVISTGFFYYRFTDEASMGRYNTVQISEASDSLYILDGTDREAESASAARVLYGEAKLSEYGGGAGYRLYAENVGEGTAAIALPIYNYRYYNAYDKDKNLMTKLSPENNCICIELPAHYAGDIELRFEPPYTWRAAELVSLLTAAGTIWLTFRKKKKYLYR